MNIGVGVGLSSSPVAFVVTVPVVTNGLIRYWNFRQGVTTTSWSNLAPATIGQYDGVVSGAVLQTNGVFFDGVNDKVTFTSPGSIIPFTLEFIFQYITPVSATQEHLIGNGTLNRLRTASNRISVQAGGGVSTKPPTFTADTFIHVAYTFDPVTKIDNFYVNGVLSESITLVSDFNLGTSFTIGAVADNTAPLNGVFQFVRLYDRILTSTEIQTNYANGDVIGL